MKKSLIPTNQVNPVAVNPQDLLSPEVVKQLEDNLPDYLKEYEQDGTAVVRWSYEHLIIIEYLLREHFNFNDKDLTKLENELKKILPKVVKLKAETPLLITKESYVGFADKAVKINKIIQKTVEKGLPMPTQQQLEAVAKK